MPELVISNTSPLFYLHRLRHLDLLQKLYQRIVVPGAVVRELAAGREEGHEVPDVATQGWIHVRPVQVPGVIELITDLGAGEAEVLALALEERGSLVLLDDGFAREVATLRKANWHGGRAGQSQASRSHLVSETAAR